MSSSKLLIFGGTFDPPHRAHSVLPPVVAEALNCDRILYVPAALNPLKTDAPRAPAHHRLAMVRMATANIANAEICTIELDRPGPSFTVDTLETLRAQYDSADEFRLLIGSDQAMEFGRWKDWPRILELATPAVLLRPPLDRAQFHEQIRTTPPSAPARQWVDWIIDSPQLDISATQLRDRLVSAQDLSELLDQRIVEYIRKHRLYQG